MILDQCTTLSERVAEKKRLRLNVDQLRRFHKFRDLVALRAGRIADLLAVWRTLRDGGVGTVDCAAEASVLAGRVRDVLARFRTRSETLIEDKSFSAVSFDNALGELSTRLESELRTTWQQYADRLIPAAHPEVLAVLAPAFPRAVRLIQDRSERLERSRLVLPRSAEQLHEFTTQVNDLHTAWQQLDGGDIPDGVITFLRAAAQTGAGLDLLTEGVRGWLVAKGILRSFSIRVTPERG